MRLKDCKRCKRLAAGLRKLRKVHPDWHNAPVGAVGPADAPLLIVGLAPGKMGANRTGVPFVGDKSSGWLGARLAWAGLVDEDGLPQGVRITNAVKCLPPKNTPTAAEIRTCTTHFLAQELQHPALRCVLCLGGVAHRAVNATLGIPQRSHSFAHGAHYQLDQLSLFSAFHPSPLNTQTGRLSPQQFEAVLASAMTSLKPIVDATSPR